MPHELRSRRVAGAPERPAGACDQTDGLAEALGGRQLARAGEGVGPLWLVDPTDHTLEAFELRDGEWVLTGSAKDGEPVSIRPFDAITFSLADLWP